MEQRIEILEKEAQASLKSINVFDFEATIRLSNFLSNQHFQDPLHFVIYTHAQCVDGIMSAYNLVYMAQLLGASHETIYRKAGDTVIETTDLFKQENTVLWIADLMPQSNTEWMHIEKIAKTHPRIKQIFVLDHHVSNIEKRIAYKEHLSRFPEKITIWETDQYSAAPMCYRMLIEAFWHLDKVKTIEPTQKLKIHRHGIVSAYVQDRDLWTRKLTGTEQITESLSRSKTKNTFQYLDNLINKFSESWLVNEIDDMDLVLKKKKDLIEYVANTCFVAELKENAETELKKPVYIAIADSSIASDVCHSIIVNRSVETSAVLVLSKNNSRLSIRGKNARQIAQAYGGGGHQQAAGANIKPRQVEEILASATSWISRKVNKLHKD